MYHIDNETHAEKRMQKAWLDKKTVITLPHKTIKRHTVMKKTYLRVICLICLMAFSTTICKADGGEPTIPVITVPDNDDDGERPHYAPIHQDIYAIFDTTVGTLSLIVSPDIDISVVEIYKDGVLIISDNIPTLYYMLSAYGSGTYSIVLTTNDNATSTGNFSF